MELSSAREFRTHARVLATDAETVQDPTCRSPEHRPAKSDACLGEEEAKASVCPTEYDTYVNCAVLQGWSCDGSTGYPYFSGCDSESNALTTCLINHG